MSEKTQNIIKETDSLLISTYTSQPIVLDHAEGAYAWDVDGKKYLDFAIGIAVASLGHANPAILKTVREQSEKLMICQSSYPTQPKLDCARLLVDNTCFDQVYFSNSGTESVEACLKMVRKWAYENKSKDCNEIIVFRKSFHGRTYGSASITEKRFVQPFFEPYLPGIHFAEFNNLESVKKLVSDKTCAILVEPIQGEGGLMPGSPEFLRGLRDLCDKNEIALVFDEVQCGFGRIGYLMAYEAFGVEPDLGAWAKGMGGGFPVGCMMAKKKFSAFEVGTHGTTYGGNPLACAVAATVIREMLKPGFLENVRKTGEYFMEGLKKIQRDSNKVTDIRGMGLMAGVDVTVDIKKLIPAVQKNGLLTTQAGNSILRLTPPLTITKAQIDDALVIINKTLQEAE
ncbi:MAG: aspartate aminotransferase family protein [Alphaproteobacteria bacterium]